MEEEEGCDEEDDMSKEGSEGGNRQHHHQQRNPSPPSVFSLPARLPLLMTDIPMIRVQRLDSGTYREPGSFRCMGEDCGWTSVGIKSQAVAWHVEHYHQGAILQMVGPEGAPIPKGRKRKLAEEVGLNS